MGKGQQNGELHQFFRACIKRSFRELGLHDPAISNYVSDVLTAFARTDALYRVQAPHHKGNAHTLVDILSEHYVEAQPHILEQSKAKREREFRKYVGDYALFMSGLFRAFVENNQALDYYFQEGQRSYQKVSELDAALYQTGFLLFEELAHNFELYSGALDYMRKSTFATHASEAPFGDFLRQVEGWFHMTWSEN